MIQYLVFLGAAVQLIGSLFYAKETLSGNARPNRITWLMWSVAPLIATVASLASGVYWAVLPVFMAGFGPFLVFLVSFINPKSYWKLHTFDYICGLLSILALILWGITKNPLIAIIFSIASDGFAALPTIIKSWKYPATESVGIYVAGLFSALTSFSALRMFNLSEMAFPVYLVFIDSFLIIACYKQKIQKFLNL